MCIRDSDESMKQPAAVPSAKAEAADVTMCTIDTNDTSREDEVALCFCQFPLDDEYMTVALECGHEYHAECLVGQVKAGPTTLWISFAYLQCPECRQDIKLPWEVPELHGLLHEARNFRAKVEELAFSTAQKEEID